MKYKTDTKTLLIGVLILVLTLLTFYIRMWPGFVSNLNPLSNVDIYDSMYNLRIVEQTVANFPQYAWFDPMTHYPQGQPQDWGPLFTLISATACVLVGATSRVDVTSVSLLIPGFMAALMIPVVYLTVKLISDRKSGLIAALFMTIVPGQYFFRSYYGYFDHHIGEVLFSTIFCMCYLLALNYCIKNHVSLEDRKTWKVPILLGITCGIAYFLGTGTYADDAGIRPYRCNIHPDLVYDSAISGPSGNLDTHYQYFHFSCCHYRVFFNRSTLTGH